MALLTLNCWLLIRTLSWQVYVPAWDCFTAGISSFPLLPVSGCSLLDTESCQERNQCNNDPNMGGAFCVSDACPHLVPLNQPVCAVEITYWRTSECQLLPHAGCYWKGEFLHVCSQRFIDVQLDAPGYTVGFISAHEFEKTSNLKPITDAVMLFCSKQGSERF